MAQSWYDSAWTSRQKITINSNGAAYGLSASLTRFPFLLKITDGGNDLFVRAQAGGNDILFTAEDGTTRIPHEIENFSNGGTKDLTAWVQLPTFRYDAVTVIYMYYGNASVGSQQQKREVWDATFGTVYHLKETGTAGNYEDSTRNANAGLGGTITTNQAPTRSTDSIAGYSQDLDGTDDFVKVPGLMGQPVNATVSAWVNLDAPSSALGSTVFSIGDSLVLSLDHATPTGHVVGFFYDGAAWRVTDTTVTVAGTGWHHVAYRLDDAAHGSYVYIDGVQQGAANYAGSPTYTLGSDTYIGKHGNGSAGVEFNGRIDELRFSGASRSPDWIKTEYQTQAASAQGAPASPDTVDNTRFIKQKERQLPYFQYKRALTINAGMVLGTHTDFPVLVHVTLNPAHVMNANGYDTMFTDDNGVPLSHEIESYNSGTGELWAWVKVPTLQSSADTVLYLYYGNGNLVSPPSAMAVWNSSYGMVQHLNKDPSGSQTDSTANGNNGTSNGMTAGNLVDAMIGKGVQFDGSHYITVPSSASLNATAALTLSAWVKLTDSTNDQKILGKTNSPAPTRGYLIGAQTAGLYPETWDSLGTHRTFNSGTITSGQWTYLTLTSTANGNMIGYVNGVQVNSISAGTNNLGTSAGALVMGAAPWDPTQLRATGTLDETRVSTSVRSANWIATEYNNQSDTTIGAGKFIKSVGAETTAYPSWWNASWNYRKTLTLNADKVGTNNIPKDNSDLANMPVLLSFTDAEIGSAAQWSGNDIAFTINGQKLDHELVSFDRSSGKMIAWVKIPAISSWMDTRVDVYYGNPAASNQQNVAGTWSNGFSGVWHLEEAGGGVTSVYRDSSPAGNDGTSGTFTVTGTPTAGPAKIAGGQSFDGIANTITTSWTIANPQEFTLSAWVNTSSTTGNKIIGFENAQTGTGTTIFDRSLWIGTDGRAYFGCYSGTTDIAASALTYNNGAWHYLVGVRNDTTDTLTLYADGAQVGTKANASAEVRTQWWRIGSYKNVGWTNGADGYFPGTLDEVRISYAARSADWVKAEYVNQNAPGSNITIDPPPTLWTWTGASGAPWSVNGNWDQGIYPNDNTRQVLVGGTGGPQLGENIAIKRLTIEAAHSVDLNGYTLSIDDANGLENQGTVYFSGRTGVSSDAISRMDTTSGTVVYRTTAASIRDFGAVDYYNLTVDGITADLVSDITVAGNLALANNATLNLNGHTLTVLGDSTGTGTVAAGSGTLVVKGNLTVSALSSTTGNIQIARIFNPGAFTAGTGTVEFIDPAWNGEILGSRTFNNLRIVTPGKTVLFQNGTTQIVADFTVTGTIGSQVSLRSTTDASQWTITPTTKSVSYGYVKDSIASSVISANNSTDGGNNNVNWQFNSAGQLHHFAISAIASPQIAGAPFSVTITAQDILNATVAGFTGTVTISDRTGTVTPLVSGSFAGGVRTETVIIGAAATNVTIVVNNGTIAGQSASFDVQAYTPFVGLIGHWRFDDGSGTTAIDSSVSSNPGTLVNGPTWTAGRVGGAVSFDGTDDYVTVANEATYDVTGNLTVAAWIKVDTFTKQWQSIVTKGDSAWRLLRNNLTDALCFAGTGLTADTVYGTRNVNDGQWHHAVGVYDGTRLSLYVDGTLDASAASTGAIGTNNYNVFIGENAQATGRQFDGLIDDVRVYNRALSATDVSALYYDPTSVVTITARQTEDADGDGRIDRIKVTASEALNDAFAGLTVTVSGYTLSLPTSYDTGGTANDAVFYVLINEGGSPDSGATPAVRITGNSSLKNLSGTRWVAPDPAAVPATDLAAPVLSSVSRADGGNNGAGAGDTITLVYSEALSAASISAALVGANANNALAAGSGNITGALADIIAESGSFATPTTATASATTLTLSADGRTVTVTLGGTVVDGVFPAGVFTPVATYGDTHGNAANTAATQTATGTWDGTAPQLVSVTLADAGNAGAGIGDTITLIYNEALSAASISAALVGANTNNALAAGSGNITGALADIVAELGSFATPATATASATTLALSADGRTVTITLGGTVADGVFPSGVFTPAGTYTDRYGANTINTTVTRTAGGSWDATAPQLVSVALADAGNAGAGVGDTVTLVYNEALSAASISAALVGANTNNALAAGSGNITGALADIIGEMGGFATPATATASAATLTLSADGLTVTITLGGTVADGVFPAGAFTPAGSYTDRYGANVVNTSVTQTATGSWDATAPQLVSVTLADAGNAGAGVGDTVTLIYDEALSASSISAVLVGANTNNALAAGSGNITGALADIIAEFGSFATPTTATASAGALTLSADGRTVTITLGGTVTDGVFPAGVFTPAASYTDAHANSVDVAVTQTASGSWDATAPQIVSVNLADAGNAGAGIGDTITLVYNEALSAASISAALVGANTNNALAAGSGNVTGAFADIIAELGSFATPTTATATATTLTLSADGRAVTITLGGTVADGVFPAGVFTPAASYTDAHANSVDVAVTRTAGGSWDATAPQLVSVTLADAGNAGAGVGDTITMVYNEALSASSISAALVGANTNNALAAGSGNVTGALADIIAELGSFATPTTATASCNHPDR